MSANKTPVAKPDFREPVDHSEPEKAPAETPENEKVSTGRQTAPTETSKPDVKTVEEDEDSRPQSYVWLANGDVRRCFNEDLPQHGGGGEFGHWNEGDSVHQIVGIYPVEEKVK